jgi:hypothetical protein
MPGTYAIDPGGSFTSIILMGVAPKPKYGEAGQDTTATGVPKWEAQLAVSFPVEDGQRPQADVITVTIPAQTDPGAGITIPGIVEVDGLRLGVSSPEAREGGRVRGGKPWFQATALRSPNGSAPVRRGGES